MILMIDNYDSFTYNLVQYIEQLGTRVMVLRNDALSVEELAALKPVGLVISPGPGRPSSAGISCEAVKYFSGRIPVLGVCLGHQVIAEVFGGVIVHSKKLMHGKTSRITSDEKGLYQGIKKQFEAMRYHSLSVSRDNLPEDLMICSESDDGEIMGLRHREHQTEGIQFHPESIMTPVGKRLLRNFLNNIGNN